MTRLLYYENPDQLSFTAEITAKRLHEGATQLELSQTSFYVEGGGQPSDTGTLNGATVTRVFEEDGHVWHEVHGVLDNTAIVEGRVDGERRRDFSTQHTGQHILSQAFMRLFGAETSSFHLTEHKVSIDLSVGDLTTEQVSQAESMSNSFLRLAQTVKVTVYRDRAELPANLRKLPVVEGDIRLVEIPEFDICPCGGTHLRNTAEIGLIKVLGVERARGKTRVEFSCGDRAIAEFEKRLASDTAVSQLLSEPYPGHADAVGRLLSMEKDQSREVARLGKQVLELRALTEEPISVSGGRSIYRFVPWTSSLDEAKLFLTLVLKKASGVGLAVLPGDPARVVVSSNCDVNAGAIVKDVLGKYGGKGGGTPQSAQGGLPEANLGAALAELDAKLRV